MTSGGIRAGLFVVPAFGERGSFVPLGLAYLNQVLREDSIDTVFQDVNEAVRLEAPALHSQLADIGFSPNDGGFFGPDLELMFGCSGMTSGSKVSDAIRTDVRKRLANLPPMNVALITLWDSNIPYAVALGCGLKEQGIHVVVGGPAASVGAIRRLLVSIGAADAVVAGEGEPHVVPLVRSLGEGLPIPLGPGVTGRDEQGEIRDGGAGAAESIHALPLPSFAGMPTPEWIPILTSRGCIRDCSFCTEKFFWKRYRQRKVEDVLAEIEMRIAETGRRTFEFNDDLLNGHIRWLERFCDELIQRKLGIRWICFMEPYRLSRNLLERVAEAGAS